MSAMRGDVTVWPPLSGRTTARLSERTARHAAKAKIAWTADVRDALDLLALRDAVLTAQREFEDQRAT